jgi:hypothetical protein
VLSHRECFREALEVLECLALRLGGDFSEAAEFWRAERSDAPAPRTGARPADPAAPTGEGRRRGRRGRRRPGRGQDAVPEAASRAAAGSAPAARARPAKRADLPPPWDDGYFFAALPSVPDGDGVELREAPSNGAPSGFLQGGYAAPEPETEDAATDGEAGEAQGAGEARPRRRRRRRRRRPREPLGSGGSPAGDGGDPSTGSGQ